MAKGEESAMELMRRFFLTASQGTLSYDIPATALTVLKDAKNFGFYIELCRAWVANARAPETEAVYCDLCDVLQLSNDRAGADLAYRQALLLSPGNRRATAALAACRT